MIRALRAVPGGSLHCLSLLSGSCLLGWITAQTPSLPLLGVSGSYFIENRGQWHPDVFFLCRLYTGDVWITRYGLNMDFYQISETSAGEGIVKGQRLILRFVNASPSPVPSGRKNLQAYDNYFMGKEVSRHFTHVPLYQEVVVRGVYQGIDVRYYIE